MMLLKNIFKKKETVLELNKDSEAYKEIMHIYNNANRVDVSTMSREEIKKRFF